MRPHKAKPGTEESPSRDAYESGWYAVLSRQASEETEDDRGHQAPGEPDEEPGGASGSDDDLQTTTPGRESPPTRLAEVTPLVPHAEPSGPRRAEARSRSTLASSTGAVWRAAQTVGAAEESSATIQRADRHGIRIGVRRLDDPESVYVGYLTGSAHRDYFKAAWWPDSPFLTPAHLWRANHLGAGWDAHDVDRFMNEAAERIDRLVASAPHAALPGSPERRMWLSRFIAAEPVREFGIGRVSKTLHPMLPELVPDLDPAMMAWARGAWFDLEGPASLEDPESWVELVELLEDVLVLHGESLGHIARRVRSVAPQVAPLARLGPILAAFWESYWAEAGPGSSSEPRRDGGATGSSRASQAVG